MFEKFPLKEAIRQEFVVSESLNSSRSASQTNGAQLFAEGLELQLAGPELQLAKDFRRSQFE